MSNEQFRDNEEITILRGRRDFLRMGAAFAAVPMLGGAAASVAASESGAGAGSDRMVVTPSGSRDSFEAPPEYFTATNAMTHIAIQEFLDGENVVWLDPVTDEQYEM